MLFDFIIVATTIYRDLFPFQLYIYIYIYKQKNYIADELHRTVIY